MTERSRDDLERARAKWWATVSSGDLDGYLSLFAEDAVWVTPELGEIEGREAIRAWLEPVFAQFDYELTITVADVRVAGDLGIERARFVSRMTPRPVVPHAPAPLVAPEPVVPAPLPPQQWVPGDDEPGPPAVDPGAPAVEEATDAPGEATPDGGEPVGSAEDPWGAPAPVEGTPETEGDDEASGAEAINALLRVARGVGMRCTLLELRTSFLR